MQYQFKYNNVHHCEAVVLSCIDFRFWRETVEFVEQELGVKYFDFPSLPGAAKTINESIGADLAMKCISVPCDLHHAQKIIIVNHEDCGAYGGSKRFNNNPDLEQEFHENKLREARVKILKSFPEKEVVLVYARLVDDKENVEFYIVE